MSLRFDMQTIGHDFDLRNYLDRQREQINRMLLSIFSDTSDRDRPIVEAMAYSLMAGGKRLRPILCIAAAEAVGKAGEPVLRAACALEMIHTYSLIHDDLPAMDNDDLRRGHPTCHIRFGESTAILSGDALLTFAFEYLSATALTEQEHALKWLAVLADIAKAAGYGGMIGGQMQDISAEGACLSIDQLKSMHALKTGTLIEASVAAGARLGGGRSDEMERLRQYARNIGMAFQVVDDILNVEGDPLILGKAIGTDCDHQKNTFPSVLGIEKSKNFAVKLVNSALKSLDGFDSRSDPLRAIAVYIVERNR